MLLQRLLLFLFLLTTLSCTSTKSLVYFNNIKAGENYKEPIAQVAEPQIQPDDLLAISVSSLNPESNILFNNGTLTTTGSATQVAAPVRSATDGYLVDKSGNINFPVLGPIELSGLTKVEATNKLTKAVKDYVKNPIINIRFLNFRITVLGEVNRPASFTVPTERVNVLEALGLAGDMTPYGKRNNVLVIREKDGVRNTIRLDLNDTNAFNSPAFYLQQNDVVYVEPTKAREVQASSRSFYLPIALTALSVISILIATFKR